jgi:hypothetical protein
MVVIHQKCKNAQNASVILEKEKAKAKVNPQHS